MCSPFSESKFAPDVRLRIATVSAAFAIQSRPTGNARLRKATLPAAEYKQPRWIASFSSKSHEIPRRAGRTDYAEPATATFYPDFPEPLKLKTVLHTSLTSALPPAPHSAHAHSHSHAACLQFLSRPCRAAAAGPRTSPARAHLSAWLWHERPRDEPPQRRFSRSPGHCQALAQRAARDP